MAKYYAIATTPAGSITSETMEFSDIDTAAEHFARAFEEVMTKTVNSMNIAPAVGILALLLTSMEVKEAEEVTANYANN